MGKEYKYDLAISFAEEDRNIALALSLALEIQGVEKVYYYPNNYEATWGADFEKRLKKIYAEEAKYAVIILSRHYFAKKFTLVELNAIRLRMLASDSIVYALPVLIDDNVIEHVEDVASLGYMKWKYDPKELATILIKLLGIKKEILKPLVTNGNEISQSIINSNFNAAGDLSIIISKKIIAQKSIVDSSIQSGGSTNIQIS